MNLIQISSFYNHHQAPLSARLDAETAHHFRFVETDVMDSERRQLGWEVPPRPDYVVRSGSDCLDADAVIFGSAPERWLRPFFRRSVPVFRYTERPLKHGPEPLKYFPRLVRWRWRNPPGRPVYLLCASAYALGDYAKFGLFRGRAYKWGYFPETRYYPDIAALIGRKNRRRILWCGRFLDWKHPEDAIRAACRLKESGQVFQMDFIGTGPMENTMRQMISEMGLRDDVHILGAMSPEQVRNEMENAGIYLLTSDRNEGWGAVLNEAMNSGCAVVASHLAGAVPYLMQHKKNGLVYQSGQTEQLISAIQFLLEQPEQQQKYGRNAYKAIAEEWNAEVAAERFVHLASHILAGDKRPNLYAAGPCSRADTIKESWFIN